MLSQEFKNKSNDMNFGALIRAIKNVCEKEISKGKYEAYLNILPEQKLYLTSDVYLEKYDQALSNDSEHKSFVEELVRDIEKITGLLIKIDFRKSRSFFYKGESEVALIINWN